MRHDVTFHFGSAKVCSPAILETSLSYDKDIWIAATYYYIHFYIIDELPNDAAMVHTKPRTRPNPNVHFSWSLAGVLRPPELAFSPTWQACSL